MKLDLYCSVARGDLPNLISLQDSRLDFLPTVLVCPFRSVAEETVFRVAVDWNRRQFVACTELARPIRRTGLRSMGQLDEEQSREIMRRFIGLLAR